MIWIKVLALLTLSVGNVSAAEAESTSAFVPSLPLAILIGVVAALFVLTKDKKSDRSDS